MLLLLSMPCFAADPGDDVRRALARHVSDPTAAAAVLDHLSEVAARAESRLASVGPSAGAAQVVFRQVAASLDEKASRGLLLDPATLSSTVVDYEAFKLETYVTSGVFPKRYFGFVDGRSDSAAIEIRVLETAKAARTAIDAWQAAHDRPVRITDLEIATTFLAEGGALWLGKKDQIHPVGDVGLDDVASGLHDASDLVAEVDRAAGTDLGHLVAWTAGGEAVSSSVPNERRWLQHHNGDAGPFPYLTRFMTVEEAVAGTAVLYLWEKERADRLLASAKQAPISGRPLDEQFVIGSLVYNSGLVHDPARWKGILTFSAGQWVRDRSVANEGTRPPLNLLAPPQQLAEIRTTGRYRDQNTSWLAVYHVLQRYGAFAALHRFTDRFDPDGMIASIPSPPPPPPPPAPAPAAPAPASHGCETAPSAGWLGLLAALVLRRTRSRAPGAELVRDRPRL